MSWTINGATPESLGVVVAGWTEQALGASSLHLDVVGDDYTADAALAYGAAVTLAGPGGVMFQGKVRQTPRAASAEGEGHGYIITDAWDDLDRLIFQQPRDFLEDVVDGSEPDDPQETVLAGGYSGYVYFPKTMSLGARIAEVIGYAASAGVAIAAGTISGAVPWYGASYKDITCGELLREMLRLLPDHAAMIDMRAATPTFSLLKRTSMSSVSYDVAAGTEVVSHEVADLAHEAVAAVILRYEISRSVDGDNFTEIIIDAAPGGADGTALNTVVETVPIYGGDYQSEYARITTRTIPKESDTEADKKTWLVQVVPELAALAATHGVATVAGLINLPSADVPAQDIYAYKRTIVEDGVPRPAPINPNAEPLVQTVVPDDYPREIIEGTLPDWAGRRYRPVSVVATIGISEAALAGVADAGLKAGLAELLKVRKKFGSTAYFTAKWNGRVMGTNARTKVYRRSVKWNQGEEPPTGVAAAVLAEMSAVRHTGSLMLVGVEPDVAPRPNKRLVLTGGRPEWTAGEVIQEVSFDISSGTTQLSYGPPEQLGPQDIIERLRAARRNAYSTGERAGEEITDGVGGAAAAPLSEWARTGTPERLRHPFEVEGAGVDFRMYPGYFFWTRAVAVVMYESGMDAADVTFDGTNQPGEVGISFGGAAWAAVADIPTMQAGDFGIYFETDAIGHVTSAEMRWLADVASSLVEYDGLTVAGKFFQPVVRFSLVAVGEYRAVPIVTSAYFWKGCFATGGGTTFVAP